MKIFTLFTAVILMTCAGLFAQVDLEDGLVASYPFNGDATDETGNGNDGVVTAGYAGWGGGTPILTTDRFGAADKAYYFDGGGNIEVPYSTIINPGSITLSWWIYMEERPNNDYMISMKGWECYKVNLQTENKVFGTVMAEDPDTPGSFIVKDKDHDGEGLVDSTWYHLAVSFGGGHMKFYIDGVMVKDWDDVPNSNIIDISADPHNLVFGQNKPTSEFTGAEGTTGEFFKGKMDDIMIYNRVLTDAEVLALYDMPVTSTGPGLINRTFELSQNYPNPFKSSTTIKFSQLEKGLTTLRVYNAVGQEVATLISEELMPGTYQTTWNAGKLSSGVYFYRLSVNGFQETKKLFLLK